MNRQKYNVNTSFIDLVLNTLLGFVALFLIAFVSIKVNDKNKSNKNSETKAEIVITVTWPKELDDDVDIYLQDPQQNLVFFRQKENHFLNIDRDDLGHVNDFVETSLGRVEVKENREVATIRGIIPGEYTFNLHLYGHRSKQTVPVDIRIEKMNPYSVVLIKKVELERVWQELTVCKFNLNEDGIISDITDEQKQLVVPPGATN